MIYITGDTHREFDRIKQFCQKAGTRKSDILIILGDAGINYYPGFRDRYIKTALSQLPITLFCIHGNHEIRPSALESYQEHPFMGGTAYIEPDFPSLVFAKDGQIYDFAGKRTLVVGGAYSIDKDRRLEFGWGWWPDEQPSHVIRQQVEAILSDNDWTVDIVLTHTCPLGYEPHEVFLPMVKQSTIDKSTEMWLDSLEKKLHYEHWYCGHFHTEKVVEKIVFLFEGIRPWPNTERRDLHEEDADSIQA